MARDAVATKARILDAAVIEFAEHGLAGARVDRIADRAEANKQLLYAHFGNKESLFDASMEASLAALLDEVPFDANALPEYAVALLKFGDDNPHLLRLARWHSLERPGAFASLPMVVSSNLAKLRALEDAQHAGVVDGTLTPQELLAIILTLAQGDSIEDLPEAHRTPALRKAKYRAVRHAVSRLTTPTL